MAIRDTIEEKVENLLKLFEELNNEVKQLREDMNKVIENIK